MEYLLYFSVPTIPFTQKVTKLCVAKLHAKQASKSPRMVQLYFASFPEVVSYFHWTLLCLWHGLRVQMVIYSLYVQAQLLS